MEQAGVRTTEPNSQRKNIERIQIEGVIIEAFASSSMKRFYFGQISSMAARLGIQREEIKPHIDGDTDPGIPGWADLPKEEREAILCAMGAENA
ncbi:hypothetical protein [Thioclava sp. ES.031]|uniref:hypothetical protein n=1 Tax=Thioclava sp. ES.031 TaxID=1798203 RepID=UPI001C3F26AC|nr:hypothetical protein [Thioclava sp. ES.031]